jgi:TonB family protein
MNQALVGYVSLAGSLALHGLAVTRGGSDLVTRAAPEPAPSFVEFTTPEPLPEPTPEPPPEPEPEPPPKPLPPERPQLPPLEASEPPPDTPPAPDAPAAELTGVTLTGDSESSFGAPEGNAEARDGTAIGAPARRSDRPMATAVSARVSPPSPPPALPLSRLSRKPMPPALGAALERNYPREARALGKSGDAKVRARVESTGEIRSATITRASSPDFGEACRRTLLGSRWSTPLDEHGKPAATWIVYQCRFRVD